jgi:hypothetical protein
MTDARGTQPFPTKPAEVTSAWLTTSLRAAGAIGPDDTVTGFSSSPIGEGVWMLGEIVRLELQYESEPGPLPSLVAKFATPTEANRAVAMTFRMYEREVRFFRDLADRVSEGIPDSYAAEIDLGNGDFVLLLQDLADYRPGDQVAGCGVRDAELGIDAMAELHAAWWDAGRHPELAWVPTVDGELHRVGMVAGTRAGWEPFVAGFGHLVAPEIVEAGPRYLAGADELHLRMGRGPQTLIHGDFRLDNLLFGTEPDHYPIALVDWQGLIVSKGAHDLAYLLSQNLDTEARRKHERELGARYHQALSDAGVESYTAEGCWDDYRLASLWLFEYAVVIGGTLDPANERGTAFMTGLIERSSATIMDLELLDLLP